MKMLKHWLRTVLAVGLLASTGTVHALENTAWVTLSQIAISSYGSTPLYQILPPAGWGFTNCTALNGGYLNISGAHPAAKDWLALLLTAKATGQSVQITITSCTDLTIIQIVAL